MKDKIASRILLIIHVLSLSLIFVFRGVPLLTVIVKSFTTNDLASNDQFVGFSHYVNVLSDDIFWQSMSNSMLLMISVPILMMLGFITALLINEGIKFSGIYKTVILFPQVVSTLTTASVFGAIFGYNGPVNAVINLLGAESLYWLGEKTTALCVIILCVVFTSFGWQTLIYSGALASVDPNVKFLIQLDGVSFWGRCAVYFYQIKETVLYSFILNVIYGFSGYFSIIYTLTRGGPGYSTTTIDYLIYLRSFKYGNELSSAYTTASILFAFVMILVSILFVILTRGKSNEQQEW